LCDTATESDALSTACMVLDDEDISKIVTPEKPWLVFLEGTESYFGKRPLPPTATGSN
jgi:thiamine biosynthesis lipoprotein ApbE